MYIGLILASTLLFSFSFYYKNKFQEREGNTLTKAMVFSLIGNFIGIITTLFMGVEFSFSVFSFVLAMLFYFWIMIKSILKKNEKSRDMSKHRHVSACNSFWSDCWHCVPNYIMSVFFGSDLGIVFGVKNIQSEIPHTLCT